MYMCGQDKDIDANLRGMDARPRQIIQRTAYPMSKGPLTADKIKSGFSLTLSKWKSATVARTVSTYDDVSPHSPSASPSPIVRNISNACS
ncbi:hypothetical protein GMLC_10710 [Geomonas limicola]|uniref:Uncharacterized protein n=1 Tax=Geomonas limicola TaxID=2740186 RepID=A0A6V8N4K1_9BACT|nr:hypothetical protein GMLC_10710 [Geomonas limicola]